MYSRKHLTLRSLGDSENLKFFKEFVLEFYDKNIKWNSETALKLSSDDEDDVWYFLGTMITKDYTFPDVSLNKNDKRIAYFGELICIICYYISDLI